MSERKPTRLVLEYEDGSSKAIDFAELPGLLQFDLLRQPFAGGATPDKNFEDRFLLLEWEDGWKEVFQIGSEYESIQKYYVITRPEDVGRLSFKQAEGYPELLELVRRPKQISRIDFTESFILEPGTSRREGKKTEQEYKLNSSGASFAPELEAFKAAAAEEGIEPAALLQLEGEALAQKLNALRKRMGIVAGQRQRDVLNFVAYLASLSVKA